MLFISLVMGRFCGCCWCLFCLCLRVIFAFVVLDVFKTMGLLNDVFVGSCGLLVGCVRLDIVVVWFFELLVVCRFVVVWVAL